MTEPTMKPHLGRYGIWTVEPIKPEWAVEIEGLGYGAVWVGGAVAADLGFVEPILERTSSLTVATGVVNIWSAPATAVAESYHRIEAAFPGRFLLGIGAGHREHTQEYRKPYQALVDYLDDLDRLGVPSRHRVVAALGPKVLKLSADRSAGAHTFLVTPPHTRRARDVIGDSVLLAPEHTVMVSSDAEQARAILRQIIGPYLNLSNYVNNWKRLGFTDFDVAPPASDRLIDSLVAHGSAEDIAKRLHDHLQAGADHVAIQVLSKPDALLPILTELAGPLGLTPRT